MAVSVSMINMKGGVGKTTLTFNLAHYCHHYGKKRVLVVDLDPQSNLSQYFMGAREYREFLEQRRPSVVDIFEEFHPPAGSFGAPRKVNPAEMIIKTSKWGEGCLDLLPSRLELAYTLWNPTEKAELLPRFLSRLQEAYDLILIDCAPTESVLTIAAYRASRYVVVPIKPEFLSTIGLPLLVTSLERYRTIHAEQSLDLAGIVFNDVESDDSPEKRTAIAEVRSLAREHKWRVMNHMVSHSRSFPRGARAGDPIFRTSDARRDVISGFLEAGKEFMEIIGFDGQSS